MLSDGAPEPSRPKWPLHRAGDVDREWKFLKGLTNVWSCGRHADELARAGRLPTT